LPDVLAPEVVLLSDCGAVHMIRNPDTLADLRQHAVAR